ncbi:MAG TPA: TIGR03087 family PEP-CTERM/XrtA system glycosyltransferase [Rhodopila sp.]|nr:TIGR03087 family PEP-CTERM/XrtA system glycosyltransferase [Rhodopila sp.]
MADLLFLSHRLPYPPTKGEKIRAYHELRDLAQRYDIHLGCLVDDPDDLRHVDAVRAWCRDVHVAVVDRRIGRLCSLRGLLGGTALSVAYFRDRGLAAWVRRVAATIRPAATFVYSSNMAPYVLDLPRTGPLVVDFVDVDSEKWRALGAASHGPMRLVYRREARLIAALERRVAQGSDVSAFVSDAEAALFARLNPGCAGRVRGVGNGVDHRYFDPGVEHPPPYEVTRPNFVFTGTMDYPPNVEAVGWFVAEMWPLVRRVLPEARFHIVGAHPGRSVRLLASVEGVAVTGRVADVRPYLAHATACVAPMRIARGIQNKVLEAMAMGRPVVLTAGALEGIAAVPGREVVLADTAEAFAAACCRLATGGEGDAIGAAARARILRDHDWGVTLRRFDDVLRQVAPGENRTAGRMMAGAPSSESQ